MLFWLVAIIVIGTYLYLRYGPTYRQFMVHYEFAKTVPGPPFKEIIGKTGRTILPWYTDLQRRYGSTFKIWFLKDLFIFFTDPDDIKTILGSNQLLSKSITYDFLRPWLGNGLLTNSGLTWHQRRKLLTPAFHFRVLGSFKEPMEQKCEILINRLAKVADGSEIDIYSYITLFALDIIAETAMGVKKQTQENLDSDFVTATQRLCAVLYAQVITIWYRIPMFYKWTKNKRERDNLLKILHNETDETIRERRKLLETSNIKKMEDAEQNELGIKRRLAFLDILLLAQMEGANLSDADIRQEVDTFMFEGHDTTSSALSFAIYLLSKHPDVQNKALEECREKEGKETETMKYLEAVIKETLRLYPSVPFYSRKITEPMEIGNRLLPVGTSVSILGYLLHRNPEIYPNPEAFIPERYLTEQDFHPYAFVGFSAGPRNCIGQKFAMLELKCTLSKLLLAFEILPVAGFEPIPLPELVMKTANGVKVRLRKR